MRRPGNAGSANGADVWDKVDAYRVADDARAAGTYPYFRAFDYHDGPEAVIDGKRVTMFGSNNYLGLTTHPKVREAAADAVRSLGQPDRVSLRKRIHEVTR